MARIKGTALRGVLKYIKSIDLEGGIPAVLAELPAAPRAAFERPILSSEWYPYDSFVALLSALAERKGGDQAATMREYGRFAASQDTGAVFKLVSIFSVERALQMSTLFWKRHCDAGSFATQDLEAGHGMTLLRGFPTIDGHHSEVLAGWIEGMGAAAGASNPRVEIDHRAEGIAFDARWD